MVSETLTSHPCDADGLFRANEFVRKWASGLPNVTVYQYLMYVPYRVKGEKQDKVLCTCTPYACVYQVLYQYLRRKLPYTVHLLTDGRQLKDRR